MTVMPELNLLNVQDWPMLRLRKKAEIETVILGRARGYLDLSFVAEFSP